MLSKFHRSHIDPSIDGITEALYENDQWRSVDWADKGDSGVRQEPWPVSSYLHRSPLSFLHLPSGSKRPCITP